MWGVVDDSAEEPWHELWGLFRPDGDVSWQHKALCAQTDPEAFADAFVYPPVGVYFEAENKGELPPCWSGLALDCPNVRLQCLKKAEDGRGYILRLYETSGKAGVATLRFAGLLPQRVVLTTLVEEDKETLPMNGASLSCAIDAWGILTLRLLESN